MESMTTNRNVLIAVDVQNDFVYGSLAVDDAEAIIKPINSIAQTVRTRGGQVVFTRDWHPAETPHFDTWPVHCVSGTDGADFHRDLAIQPSDIIVSKGMGQTDGYSGWEGISDDGVTLEQLLRPKTPQERIRVFIGGLATDYCVRVTSLDIVQAVGDDTTEIYLLEDAIRAVNLEANDGNKAITLLGNAGVLLTTSQQAITMMEQLS